jgi:uncharacterized Zn-binding protein involved in type VI secretion
MTDRLVAKGDLTTTLGRVLGGSSSWYASNGQTLARRNDLATCGICEGAFPILGTADTWLDQGVPTVRHLDRVLCPCGTNRVLSGNHEFLFTGSGAASSRSAATMALPDRSDLSGFDELIVLRDENGDSIANQRFRIRSADGEVYEGTTTDAGETVRVRTDGSAQLEIELLV